MYIPSKYARLLQNKINEGNQSIEERRVITMGYLKSLNLTLDEKYELFQEVRVHGMLSIRSIDVVFAD